jgi:hypothetical protein
VEITLFQYLFNYDEGENAYGTVTADREGMNVILSKRAFQAAINYGVKKRGHPYCPRTGERRWTYFADIYYFTDWTSTREVTSWALEIPIVKETISNSYIRRFNEARRNRSMTIELVVVEFIMRYRINDICFTTCCI